MVGARQDVAQPDGHEPAQAQPLVLAVGREVGIQDVHQSQTLHMGQKQWHVVHPFCVYGWLLVHTTSLPYVANPV